MSWIHRGKKRKGKFILRQSGDFRWLPGDASGRSYSEFLTSQSMADFAQLASACSSQFPANILYVSAKATADDSDEPRIADKYLMSEIEEALNAPPGQTRLIFVKGDAGSGKTTLLRHLTGNQARLYRRRKADYLYLYVSAQARALSNLRDAFAGETQDLRAAFTRDAVGALTRRGLLVPIIDGFDEMLGAAGYGDAFSSLQQFLAELAGGGVIVVSARSSFYEVEFLTSTDPETEASAYYDLRPISLRAWSGHEIKSYLSKVETENAKKSGRAEVQTAFTESDIKLLQKPFFASQYPHYLDATRGQLNPLSLLDYLIHSYIQRESAKIVDRVGQPLLDIEGHALLFEEAAEYMWSSENRQLNSSDLKTVAEIVAIEKGLDSDAASQFVTKITSYAGFSTTGALGQKRFVFEHDVYFDFFLSSALRKRLNTGANFQFLDRGILPAEVIEEAISGSVAQRCVDVLDRQTSDSLLQGNRRLNAGAILSTAFRRLGKVDGGIIRYCEFKNVSFGEATLVGVTFSDCSFKDVHFEMTKFDHCRFLNCFADGLYISDKTVLDIQGLEPGKNIRSISSVDTGPIFSPSEIARTLSNSGAQLAVEWEPPLVYSQNAQEVIDLLHKLIRQYRRANVLCVQDDTLARMFQDPNWQVLCQMLIGHGIISEEIRPTSGKRKSFIRLRVLIPDLMRHEDETDLPDDDIGKFWQAVRAL